MPAHRTTFPLALIRFSSLTRLPARLMAAAALARSRRSLGRLDDHILRDIGLTRAEAEAEARQTSWDPPRHWKG